MKHSNATHETSEQASLYALGALSQREAEAFQTHLSECATCETEVESFHSALAALGCAAVGVEAPVGAREKILAGCAAEKVAREPGPKTVAADLFNRFLTIRADEGTWVEAFAGIHIKQLFVDKEKGTVTSLFKIMPGAHAPLHGHSGIEQCLVIEGDFHLNDEVLGPGDFTIASAGHVHHTAFSETGGLLLIVSQLDYTMSHA